MFRIILASFGLGFYLFLAPAAAVAQPAAGTEAFGPEVLAALAQEPPLAQEDVDAYLKALPQLLSGATPQEAGFTETRLAYVSTKIGLAQTLTLLPAEALPLDKIPEVLRPTRQEMELVKNNLPALEEAALAAAKRLAQP